MAHDRVGVIMTKFINVMNRSCFMYPYQVYVDGPTYISKPFRAWAIASVRKVLPENRVHSNLNDDDKPSSKSTPISPENLVCWSDFWKMINHDEACEFQMCYSHCQIDLCKIPSDSQQQCPDFRTPTKHPTSDTVWLVGALEHSLFSHILGLIIPIDFHIFQRGSNHQPDMILTVGKPLDLMSSFSLKKRMAVAVLILLVKSSPINMQCI